MYERQDLAHIRAQKMHNQTGHISFVILNYSGGEEMGPNASGKYCVFVFE